MADCFGSKGMLDRRSLFAVTGALAVLGAADVFRLPRTALAETSAEVRARADAVLAQLNELQADLAVKSDIYYAALAEEEAAEAAMEDCRRRIDECQAEIEKLKQRLAVRVANDYKTGKAGFLDIIFNATSFSAFINNAQISLRMSRDDVENVRKVQELQAEIETEEAEYARQEAIAEAKRIEARAAMEEAQAVTDEIQAVFDDLDRRANQLEEEEAIAAWLAWQKQQEEEERRLLAAGGNNGGGGNSGGGNSGGGGTSNAGQGYSSGLPFTGNLIVDRALQWVGKAKYVWNKCTAGEFDCSGLVAYAVTGVYRRLGNTGTMISNPNLWKPISWAQAGPGDIFLRHDNVIQHTGILYGFWDGHYWIIHAATPERGVVADWVDPGAWNWYRYMG